MDAFFSVNAGGLSMSGGASKSSEGVMEGMFNGASRETCMQAGVRAGLHSASFDTGGRDLESARAVPIMEVWPPVLIGGRKQDVSVRGWFLTGEGGYLNDGASVQMTVGGIQCANAVVVSDDPFNKTCVKAVKGTLDLTNNSFEGQELNVAVAYNPIIDLKLAGIFCFGPDYNRDTTISPGSAQG